jgi:hypothetical protein
MEQQALPGGGLHKSQSSAESPAADDDRLQAERATVARNPQAEHHLATRRQFTR